MRKKRTRLGAAGPLVTLLCLLVAGFAVAASAARTPPAFTYRLTAQLGPAQEVPAPLTPTSATGQFDGLLVPGKLPRGCHVIVGPPRSMIPARIVCDNGRPVVPVRPALGVHWTLVWRLSFSGLTGPATAAHIQLGARGQSGPVTITLCGPCDSPSKGVVTVTGAQALALLRGSTYVNVHTAKNPDGEIRGQIVRLLARPIL
jgi:hypothetical protein